MRKLILTVLAFVLAFSLCSCESEKSVLEEANKLIQNGQIKEAYELLYVNSDFEGAKEMLEKFNIVYTKAESKNYSVFNKVRVCVYNEHGDIVSDIVTAGVMDAERDANKTEYKYTYDSEGRMLTCDAYHKDAKEPSPRKSYSYDSNGNLISEKTDYSGNIYEIRYEYDKNQNVLRQETFSEGVLAESYSYEYDASGNCVKESFLMGEDSWSETVNYYDSQNRLIKTVTHDNFHEGTREYTYNEQGDATKWVTTSVYYDDNGDREVTTEMNYRYKYDENGRIVEETSINDYGTEITTKYVYNERGDVIKKENNGDTDRCIETSYEYDENGILRKSTEISNAWTTSLYEAEYNEHGDMVSEKSITSDDEHTYEYTYNEQGLMLTKCARYASGKTTTYRYTYDEQGRLIKELNFNGTDEANAVTKEYTYDEQGRLSSMTSDEKEYKETTQYIYNEHGDLESETTVCYGENFAGNSYEYTYSEDGKKLTCTSYSPEGVKKKLTEYNERGDITKERYYSEDKESLLRDYEYDEQGNLMVLKVSKLEDDEWVIVKLENYTYDEFGIRLTELSEDETLVPTWASFAAYSDFMYFYEG